ncbi:MAG TPA: hypothetical protein VH092_26945 [Urbifossiella sp.]|jgi:hypothetical protein|nr:hypothetical protein [Urbifossiella sp.]
MSEHTLDPIADLISQNAAFDEAHARATREALLEHARLGRPVCEARDGTVVWLSPAEIFARYGLNEYGRPVG